MCSIISSPGTADADGRGSQFIQALNCDLLALPCNCVALRIVLVIGGRLYGRVMDSDTDIAGTNVPVACTLTSNGATKQALEWRDLHLRASTVAAIEGGVRMTLPASLVDEIEDLARREAGCCAYLTIDTSVTDDVLTLDISSANPDALPVISALAGISFP